MHRVHYRKQWLCRVSQALGKAHKTLSKGFSECNTRQIAHGKAQKTLGKQHTISIVPANVSLPSVFYRALDKYFAES